MQLWSLWIRCLNRLNPVLSCLEFVFAHVVRYASKHPVKIQKSTYLILKCCVNNQFTTWHTARIKDYKHLNGHKSPGQNMQVYSFNGWLSLVSGWSWGNLWGAYLNQCTKTQVKHRNSPVITGRARVYQAVSESTCVGLQSVCRVFKLPDSCLLQSFTSW